MGRVHIRHAMWKSSFKKEEREQRAYFYSFIVPFFLVLLFHLTQKLSNERNKFFFNLNVKRIPFGVLSFFLKKKKKDLYEKLMLQDYSCGIGLFRKVLFMA